MADMWQRLTQPDVLIYLDLSYEASRARRPHHNLGLDGMEVQNERLAHARAHCDLYIDTSDLSPEAVGERVLGFLADLQPAAEPD